MTDMINLDELLIDLSKIPEENLEEFARNLYHELYITKGNQGILDCHDGEEVKFWDTRFDHAFFTPKNFHLTTEKQIIDKRRVERMKWIGALIKGEVPNSQCWLITEGRTKRMYITAAKGFIVWLEPKSAGLWTFSTAYTADAAYIFRQTRGQKLIWKK